MKKIITYVLLFTFHLIKSQCPSVTLTPISQTLICNGAPLTFSAIFSPTTNVTGKWIGPGGSQVSTSGVSPLTITTSNPGTYTFEAIHNISNCVTTQTVSVISSTIVPSMSVIATNTYNPFEVNCTISYPTFSVQTTSGPAPFTYTWTNLTTSVNSISSTSDYTITTGGNYYVEFVNGFNCKIGQQISITSNTVPPNGTVTPSSGTLTCLNSTNTFTALSTNTINLVAQWFSPPGVPMGGPVGLPSVMTLNTPGTYTVIFTDILNGCTQTNTVAVFSNTVIPIINVVGTNTVCLGSSTNFTATGASTYTWSNGTFNSTVNVLPTANTTYTVTGAGSNGCISSSTVAVFTNSTCSDVWPGDANSDGLVSTLDVLELGLQFGFSGLPRSIISNNWNSFFANNWAGLISTGKNKCHSDCNGDGQVDVLDMGAITTNFGLTHSFKINNESSLNPDITIVPIQNTIQKGTWGQSEVYIGDVANPITNLYGFDFSLLFDKALIQTDSIYFVYENSFFNNAITNIEFQKLNFSGGILYAADTRTNHANSSGNGKIGTLFYKASISFSTDSILNFSILNSTKIDANGAFSSLSGGTANVTVSSFAGINEINNKQSKINCFPNPANETLYIRTKEKVNLILINCLGEIVKTINANSTLTIVDVSDLNSGVYYLKDSENESAFHQKVMVVR